MGKKVYIGYDEFGREFDVVAEIKGYLDKIEGLEKEVSDLKRKLAEKPKAREVKKYE